MSDTPRTEGKLTLKQLEAAYYKGNQPWVVFGDLLAVQDAVLARQAERVAIETREAERKAYCRGWRGCTDVSADFQAQLDAMYPPLPPVARPSREITLSGERPYRRNKGRWETEDGCDKVTGAYRWVLMVHPTSPPCETVEDFTQCAALLSEEQQDGQR